MPRKMSEKGWGQRVRVFVCFRRQIENVYVAAGYIGAFVFEQATRRVGEASKKRRWKNKEVHKKKVFRGRGVDPGHFWSLWRRRIGVRIVTPFLSPWLLRRPVIRLTSHKTSREPSGVRPLQREREDWSEN